MFKALMQKQKIVVLKSRSKLVRSSLVVLAVLVSVLWSGVGSVLADQFQEQINQLQAQNASNQAASAQLADVAASYEGEIARLQNKLDSLQQAIVTSQKDSDELQKKIEAAEIELNHQRDVLGKNIKAMYLEGQVTTLEILASSDDLSEYVNKAEYRNSVQSKVKTTLDKINDLKLGLQTKQNQLQIIIKDQQSQQQLLQATQTQQSQMLAYTEGQKAAYDGQTKDNQAKINELRRLQAIQNAAIYGGGAIIQNSRCDIYPQNWCNAAMDSIVDTWGMYNRECVSWTAYRVAASGRYMPYWGGIGNANQWDDNAIAAGIPVDSSPRVGDVAVSNTGYYGHVMYVEAVHGDGTIAVSQFNHDWQGTYSFVPKMNTGNLLFIHFP